MNSKFKNFEINQLWPFLKDFLFFSQRFYFLFFLKNFLIKKALIFTLISVMFNFLTIFGKTSLKIFLALFLGFSVLLLFRSKKSIFIFFYNACFLSELFFWHLNASEASLKFFITFGSIFFLRDFVYLLCFACYHLFFSIIYNVFYLLFREKSTFFFSFVYYSVLVLVITLLTLHFFSYWTVWFYFEQSESSFISSFPKLCFNLHLVSLMPLWQSWFI